MMVKNIGKFLFRKSVNGKRSERNWEYKGNMYSLVGYCNIVYKETIVMKTYPATTWCYSECGPM
jgi:hypothetical protein